MLSATKTDAYGSAADDRVPFRGTIPDLHNSRDCFEPLDWLGVSAQPSVALPLLRHAAMGPFPGPVSTIDRTEARQHWQVHAGGKITRVDRDMSQDRDVSQDPDARRPKRL